MRARERPAAGCGGVSVVESVLWGERVVEDPVEEIAEALDLPRGWRSEEALSEAVERLVDMSFVELDASPACLPAWAWRPELRADTDPLQEEWASVLERSGVLDALPAAWV